MLKRLIPISIIVSLASTGYADDKQSNPDILNNINSSDVVQLTMDDQSSARGEAFLGTPWNPAISKAVNWCKGRGVCIPRGGIFTASATDIKRDGSVIFKSY